MRVYKALSKEEVTQYRSMTVDELELKVKEYKIIKNINFQDIIIGEPFEVINGFYYAFLDKIMDKYFLNVIMDGNYVKDVGIHDVTVLYENNKKTGLDISYLKDKEIRRELTKIITDKTLVPVIGGSSDCDHEYEALTYDGVTCTICNGWYCY